MKRFYRRELFKVFKSFLFILFLMFFIGFVGGCATIFPEPTPLCTPEEQETSVIYTLLNKIHSNPSSADFTLLMTSATQFKKHPERAAEIIQVATKMKSIINEGVTYAIFESKLKEELDPMQYVVASKFTKQFSAYHIPINPCDKRLILGHLDNQIDLAQTVKQ